MNPAGALVFLGDTYLPRPVDARLDLAGSLIINLEGPITRRGTPAPGKVNLRMEKDYLAESFDRPPLGVCLANNHTLDYGAEGLEDTLRALGGIGVGCFGAGTAEDRCGNPLLVDVQGVRVGLAGYSSAVGSIYVSEARPGVAPLATDRIAADVAQARDAGAKRVVVCLHWGAERVPLPRPDDVATAREIVRAGADLVVGHHTHCVQPFERVDGKYVFYGLGDCVFPEYNVPAFHDAGGRPTGLHSGRPNRWSRRSLAVRYHPATEQVEVFLLEFSLGRLRLVKEGLGHEPAPRLSGRAYNRRYRAMYLWGKVRTRLDPVAVRARLPRPLGLFRKPALWRRNLWKE